MRHTAHGPESPSIMSASTASFVLLIAAYLSLNSSLNLMNKWALGHYGLSYPLMLTSVHMAFSFAVLTPFALQTPWDAHVRTLQKQWRGVVYIGCFMALNIALNNLSLTSITLSLNQVIRSAIPVITCMLAIAVEGRKPTHLEAAGLLVLTAGVMLAVWHGSVAGQPEGIFFCCMATVCNALMMTFSGKVLSEKLDVVRLTFYTAPVSLACLLPFFLWREAIAFSAYYARNASSVGLILVVSSINAVCYNIVHSMMIKRTSAVTTTVLGEAKIVGLLLLSALLLGEGREFTVKMAAGCGLALVGFTVYTYTQVARIRAQGGSLPRLNTSPEELQLLGEKEMTSPPPPASESGP